MRRQLRELGAVADVVAAHLVAAGLLIDDEPALAYEHAKVAKSLAGRSSPVREALGVAAYAAGDYATALAELRAARRMTGSVDSLPVMADCERALGRPERALELIRDPDAKRLDRAGRVELAIVAAGARRDLGQVDAAVLALQGAELESPVVDDVAVRLWYAYADALAAAGRTEDAVRWFTAVVAEDEHGDTDAEDRLRELRSAEG